MTEKTKEWQEKGYLLLQQMLVLIVFQSVRITMVVNTGIFFDMTVPLHTLLSMICVVVLIFVLLSMAKFQKLTLEVFPDPHFMSNVTFYSVATIAVAAVAALSPLFTGGYSIDRLMTLGYLAVVLPVWEELLFRGYVWQMLRKKIKSECFIWLFTSVLYGVWNVGYIDMFMFQLNAAGTPDALGGVMLSRMGMGLVLGLVAGLIRWRAGNGYVGVLMNSLLKLLTF
ncbi:MAG: CPBP family intramembrane metalloprotease [Clostridiales bacterium]|nr:CPBP family intramembrane metalloprotease [Clostridiales bacterium]